MGNWTNWTGAGDTIAAGPGWAGLGWVSGTAATESREKNAMNSYSQTPPRPAPQSAALTHFQQETSHGCSLNTAGDVTNPGSGSGDGGMQGQGWCGHVTQCRARTLSRLLTCTAAAGPGGGAGPSGHFSLDLHSYFKLLDEGC